VDAHFHRLGAPVSGWVKWEKDLETDPRMKRMVKDWRRLCNAEALHDVTLLCGSLLRLWVYADSHIRADNTLDMGFAEIDEHLGVSGFCSIVPQSWLVEVNDHCVELPDFLEHNGTEAKKKAQGNKRVENHRQRKRNADALPDQTRPDQTRPDQKIHVEAGPTGNADALHDVPRETLSEPEIFEAVQGIRAKYPEGAAREDWITAEKLMRQLVTEGGATWLQLEDGVARYQKLCRATNRMVLNPARFFGDVDKPWSQKWPLPRTKSERAQDSNIEAGLAWLEESNARQ
jgi:hypothetical protein